jgi:hypothetical protein
MNLDEAVNHFAAQETPNGARTRQALFYRNALASNEIGPDEYNDLMEDLKRIEQTQLSAHDLEQAIMVNQIIDALKSLPLP